MGGSGREAADGPRQDLFPWFVTLGCLLAALLVFVHSAMPALAEREALETIQERQIDELRAKAEEAHELRRRADSLGHDPEAIYIEIHRQGHTPDDAYSETEAGTAADSNRGANGRDDRR